MNFFFGHRFKTRKKMSIIVIKIRGGVVDAVKAFSDKANLISKEVAEALRKSLGSTVVG